MKTSVAPMIVLVLVCGVALGSDSPITIPLPLGVDLEPHGSLAVSPDGAWVVFTVLDKRIAIASTIDTSNSWILDDTAGARAPFWSPDGRAVAYFTDKELRTIPPKGGPSTVVCTCPGDSGTWGARGILFSGAAEPRLQWLPSGARVPKKIGRMVGLREYAHLLPRFLPDGDRFLYVAYSSGGGDGKTLIEPATDLYLSDFNGQRQLVGHRASRGVMLDAATAIVQRDLAVYTIDLATGAEKELFPGSQTASVDANGVGALARTLNTRAMTRLVWFHRSGQQLSVITPPGNYWRPRVSADGQLVAYQSEGNVIVKKIATGETTRTFRSGTIGVAFSPDSRQIAAPLVGSDGKCTVAIGELESGAIKSLLSECAPVFDWSPDGRFIAVEASDGLLSFFRFVSPDGSSIVRQFIPNTNEGWLRFSPDGNGVAIDAAVPDPATLWNPQRYSVYVIRGDVTATDKPVVKLVSPGYRPVWDRASGDLMFIDRKHRLVRADATGPSREGSLPPFSRSDLWFADYDMTPDGQKIVVNERVDTIEFLPRVTVRP